MPLNWLTLKTRARRLLQDVPAEGSELTWSDDDMLDYVNAALSDITSHTARKKTMEIVLEEPSNLYDMPDDFLALGPVAIQVQGLYWQMWTPYSWKPDETLPTPYAFSLSNNAYYEWPKGTINFLWLVPANIRLRFQYYAYWDEIVDDNSLFTMRYRWMYDAIEWNVVSRALQKSAIQAANLRQYNIKVDSGTPEDNPMWTMSKFFYQKYRERMAEYPPQDRSVWDTGD